MCRMHKADVNESEQGFNYDYDQSVKKNKMRVLKKYFRYVEGLDHIGTCLKNSKWGGRKWLVCNAVETCLAAELRGGLALSQLCNLLFSLLSFSLAAASSTPLSPPLPAYFQLYPGSQRACRCDFG